MNKPTKCEREGHRYSWKPATKGKREHYRCKECGHKDYTPSPKGEA